MMRYQLIARMSLHTFITNVFKTFYLRTVMKELGAKVRSYGECLVSAVIYILFLVVDFYVTILISDDTWMRVPAGKHDFSIAVRGVSAGMMGMRMLRGKHRIVPLHVEREYRDRVLQIYFLGVITWRVLAVYSNGLCLFACTKVSYDSIAVLLICVHDRCLAWPSMLWALILVQNGSLGWSRFALASLQMRSLDGLPCDECIIGSDLMYRYYCFGSRCTTRVADWHVRSHLPRNVRIGQKIDGRHHISTHSGMTSKTKRAKFRVIIVARNVAKFYCNLKTRSAILAESMTSNRYGDKCVYTRKPQLKPKRDEFEACGGHGTKTSGKVRHYVNLFEQWCKSKAKFGYPSGNSKRIVAMGRSKFRALLRYWQKRCLLVN
ncbi:hypothetical protein VCUG_00387 [Vavraia culicis subsp. floridensis]|uniref:Uncharacterized protein n=1 Tax=Vavraia culicis (isolate floridensis) TaxID=948595 RepID=L2GWY6_VAVCU|nr:uncharacterized protein VCUG_00387 [Vavraia culicis subsp. floridensis]ELA48149.1 hypothetical protein VCUG_00387 [Vavraia culicis subsp. floridensis]